MVQKCDMCVRRLEEGREPACVETCIVDVARYFTRFLVEESCGKCVPCREGLPQVLAILDRIAEGKGEEGDIEKLEHLCDLPVPASLCALGSTGTSAGNPMRTTLRYFKDEFFSVSPSLFSTPRVPAPRGRGGP